MESPEWMPALDVLHNAGDQDILAVKHAVHFQLAAHQVLIDQNGMLLDGHVDDLHEVHDVAVGIGDLHALAAQNIGGAHQHGIAQLVGSLQRLFGR